MLSWQLEEGVPEPYTLCGGRGSVEPFWLPITHARCLFMEPLQALPLSSGQGTGADGGEPSLHQLQALTHPGSEAERFRVVSPRGSQGDGKRPGSDFLVSLPKEATVALIERREKGQSLPSRPFLSLVAHHVPPRPFLWPCALEWPRSAPLHSSPCHLTRTLCARHRAQLFVTFNLYFL